MRGGAALLLGAALAGCVTSPPRSRDHYICRSEEVASPGTLIVDATLLPDRPADYFSFAWQMNLGRPGLSLQLMSWAGSEFVAPPGRIELFATFKPPQEMATAERRLELRDGSGRAFARGPWAIRNFPVVAALRWGQLRHRATQGGAEAVVVDRSGRIEAREAIGPEVVRGPALGLESARRRWAGIVGNRAQHCPDGTAPMQEVIIADRRETALAWTGPRPAA